MGRIVPLLAVPDEVRDQDRVAVAGLARDLEDALERHRAAVEELEPEVGTAGGVLPVEVVHGRTGPGVVGDHDEPPGAWTQPLRKRRHESGVVDLDLRRDPAWRKAIHDRPLVDAAGDDRQAGKERVGVFRHEADGGVVGRDHELERDRGERGADGREVPGHELGMGAAVDVQVLDPQVERHLAVVDDPSEALDDRVAPDGALLVGHQEQHPLRRVGRRGRLGGRRPGAGKRQDQ